MLLDFREGRFNRRVAFLTTKCSFRITLFHRSFAVLRFSSFPAVTGGALRNKYVVISPFPFTCTVRGSSNKYSGGSRFFAACVWQSSTVQQHTFFRHLNSARNTIRLHSTCYIDYLTLQLPRLRDGIAPASPHTSKATFLLPAIPPTTVPLLIPILTLREVPWRVL